MCLFTCQSSCYFYRLFATLYDLLLRSFCNHFFTISYQDLPGGGHSVASERHLRRRCPCKHYHSLFCNITHHPLFIFSLFIVFFFIFMIFFLSTRYVSTGLSTYQFRTSLHAVGLLSRATVRAAPFQSNRSADDLPVRSIPYSIFIVLRML